MGYACPVCAAPQRDAEHLANHLAFTAMLHGGAHADWLDEHAPGWVDEGPAALGERVAPLADEATHETVFEDTAHEHDRGAGRPSVDWEGSEGQDGSGATGAPGAPVAPGRSGRGDTLDETTRAALAEAREMTRRMRGDGAAGGDDDSTRADGDDRTGDGDHRDEEGDPDGAAGSDGTADGDADEKA